MEQERRRNGRLDPELVTAVGLLAHDVPSLVKESVNVARLEAKKTARDAGILGAILTACGYFAAVGFFFVCVGVALIISEALEQPFAGPLIVGGGLVLIAAITAPIAIKTRRVKNAPLQRSQPD